VLIRSWCVGCHRELAVGSPDETPQPCPTCLRADLSLEPTIVRCECGQVEVVCTPPVVIENLRCPQCPSEPAFQLELVS